MRAKSKSRKPKSKIQPSNADFADLEGMGQAAPACLPQEGRGRQEAGLSCPRCGCRHFLVVDTRGEPDGIRRRRECRNCGWRVWTHEEITPPPPELED